MMLHGLIDCDWYICPSFAVLLEVQLRCFLMFFYISEGGPSGANGESTCADGSSFGAYGITCVCVCVKPCFQGSNLKQGDRAL